jgi:hypothetical protein
MKLLEENFIGLGEVRGNIFTQIKRNNHVAMYSVKLFEHSKEYYEIFVIKNNGLHEIYPKSNSFGISAFTTNILEEANLIFETLNNKVELKLKNKSNILSK